MVPVIGDGAVLTFLYPLSLTIIWLEQKADGEVESRDVSLDLVLSVYRNLRENYEFRLRYDEGGKVFKKEMLLVQVDTQ